MKFKMFFLGCLFFTLKFAYTQQFHFNQLIEMINNRKIYEINMIKSLNQAYKKTSNIGYSYRTENGQYGASKLKPTNDTKYEAKYEFDDGSIYSESEIEDKKLDEDFSIRSRLSKNSKQINTLANDSFTYNRSKIISLIRFEEIKIGFAENYIAEDKLAQTWYTWQSERYTKILPKSVLYSPNKNKLTIEYARGSDYANILKQITEVSEYLETSEKYDSFVSCFKFGLYSITAEKNTDNRGGIIIITKEVK